MEGADAAPRRVVLVIGSLGVVGRATAEALLLKDVCVIGFDERRVVSGARPRVASDETDAVNGCAPCAKRRALDHLRTFATYDHRAGDTEADLHHVIQQCCPTEIVAFGLCGRADGAALARVAVRGAACCVVASSAAVYDTSLCGTRAHRRPVLAESDAVDGGCGAHGDSEPTWAVERAARLGEKSVAVLRYFGVVHCDDNVDGAQQVVCQRLGGYGASDYIGVDDAADAAVRVLDALRAAAATASDFYYVVLNVGTGNAARHCDVERAAQRAGVSCAKLVDASPYDAARQGLAAADVTKLKVFLGWVPATPLHVVFKQAADQAALTGADDETPMPRGNTPPQTPSSPATTKYWASPDEQPAAGLARAKSSWSSFGSLSSHGSSSSMLIEQAASTTDNLFAGPLRWSSSVPTMVTSKQSVSSLNALDLTSSVATDLLEITTSASAGRFERAFSEQCGGRPAPMSSSTNLRYFQLNSATQQHKEHICRPSLGTLFAQPV
ncbi:hypothetical protein M885DRAFT_542649 [Pelagophyceae sp. CCMP2097]|nr:hypothetical protein M885DRAFT_542649 [Pelagophyceae sp. CCMP2097]|mmetsp:Transcript_8316/g.27362  ORF Transcript_8316/g.27362 Transcript_8316/m.27362 type:complete len:498 (+) Transcript_8316:734-2227(+)